MECPNCKSQNVVEDLNRSELICDDCQAVVVVTESNGQADFEELHNGRIVVYGGIIQKGNQTNSYTTHKKAKNAIHSLCSQLSLPEKISNSAFDIFKEALLKGITRGRRSSIVIGACVFLSARINHESLRLLDVSDKLKVNVYVLGKVYVKLKNIMERNVPDIDPNTLICRFAPRMELGDKMKEVASLARKLLQRMEGDWKSTGWKPTGMAAAALLISARVSGFDRNCDDLSQISGISARTIEKRVQQWAQTPSAKLTLPELKAIGDDEDDLPATEQITSLPAIEADKHLTSHGPQEDTQGHSDTDEDSEILEELTEEEERIFLVPTKSRSTHDID